MSEEFVIERGLVMPESKKISRFGDTVRALQVGESFFVGQAQSTVFSRLNQVLKRKRNRILGKFTTRKVDGGTRIWRVE